MTVSVTNQSYVFLCSVIGGMVMAFIYDLFRIKRKTMRSFNLVTYFEDLIYWIIVSLLIFLIVYISNDGQLRGFIFLGIIIGAVLYAMLLSRLIMKISLTVLNFLGSVFSTIFRIILFPVILFARLLSHPISVIFRISAVVLKEIFLAIWRAVFVKRAGRKDKSEADYKINVRSLKRSGRTI